MSVAVVWFRKDLRLTDNPAWTDATRHADTVVPLFVVDPGLWPRASTRRVALLAGHLRSLDRDLEDRGGRLRIGWGRPVDVVPAVAAETGADRVVANADVTPYSHRRDAAVGAVLPLDLHHGTLVHPPGSIVTATGHRFRVFTAFHRRWGATPIPTVGEAGSATVSNVTGDGLPATEPPMMEPGEAAARRRLAAFDASAYGATRDRPDATSRLSIDIKYGVLSPSAVLEAFFESEALVRQLAWRDFHAHLLDERPDLVERALDPRYDRIAWLDDEEGFTAWRRGLTGFPLVDAGMRQLLAEGWMHNRVRMVAASFLVKDLLVDWRRGERWFRRHLLDADVAQNVGNWQWVAGTGADAAPYFRVFNPVSQSRRFDPDGAYIRRWVPELREVPAPVVHEPWRAGRRELAAWGAEDYPAPIVDHADARRRALEAYGRARAQDTSSDSRSAAPTASTE